ncbi:putative phage head-tail adaptor [Clostridiales bacterium oral taxon 876 str. F0540]|nr:putative phage head-tail adaptor [Clostridiales bacterium oral taxon 876 str. F0540]
MDLEKLYESFNEDERLSRSKSNSIEFLTTTYFIDKYLKKGMKILDIGAGTGAYSLYYANKGYAVTAIDFVKRNVDTMKSKALRENIKVDIYQGNALDMSNLPDNTFDIVLCLGPLYHLDNDAEKLRCIEETKRVCKKNGKIFYAYLSNDMVFVTESILYNKNYLGSPNYDHKTFELTNGSYCFMTVEHMKYLMKLSNLKEVKHIAVDGLSELLKESINAFDDQQFKEWFRFHLYTCEKEEMIGYSNHIVFIAEK